MTERTYDNNADFLLHDGRVGHTHTVTMRTAIRSVTVTDVISEHHNDDGQRVKVLRVNWVATTQYGNAEYLGDRARHIVTTLTEGAVVEVTDLGDGYTYIRCEDPRPLVDAPVVREIASVPCTRRNTKLLADTHAAALASLTVAA